MNDTMMIRNPETNEWESVYLPPSGDTLPIGSIIYFDGDTIPTNYELVDDSSEYKRIKKVAQSVGLVGSVTDDINDQNDNAVANAKTVKEYVDGSLKGTVLFSGNENENLTLNESVANYTYIEVFAMVGTVCTSVKVLNPNQKRFSLTVKTSETSLLQMDCAVYLVNGNQITLVQSQRVNFGDAYLKPWDSSNIYITRVVGYGKIDEV